MNMSFQMNPFMGPTPAWIYYPSPQPQFYSTPNGFFTWTPHPAQSPYVPPSHQYWGQYTFATGLRPLPPQYSYTPQLPPGAAPVWTTAPQAPRLSSSIQAAPWLIPNPYNPLVPHTLWDISQTPVLAKRITGNHVIVDLKSVFDDDATSPNSPKIYIVCNIDFVIRLWGPIIVKNESESPVRVWDVLLGIYKFFQITLTRREVDLITESDSKNYEKMVEAMHRRCEREPSLPGRSWKEGLKRVDCLGDMVLFGGLTVVENTDGTWQFHLSLLNRTTT